MKGTTRLARLATAAALALAISACGGANGSAAPGASGCTTDVKAAGTNPDLEALLPRALAGKAPDLVDSGENCTPGALGTYVSHGISEVRFAGATWEDDNGDGTVTAIMATPPGQPPLSVAWVEEFYTAGAQNATHTENITQTRPAMPGAGLVFKLETLNDLSLQTVVVWPDGPDVWVVIVATTVDPSASRAAHDQLVLAAVAAAAAMPTP